ncbi:MAG: extracellular solute-binding protein [Clostridia bacterium]|nr:extracellular solute-binding protein [Clostridia bacterium]
MKKYLSLFLAGLMLLAAFVGCADNDPGEEDDTLGTLEEQTDEAALALSQISVDWGKEEFSVLVREDFHYDEWYTENRTEVLEDAVYSRNLAFEEFCNLELNIIPSVTAEMNAEIKKDVQAGTGEYDLLQNHMANTATLASDGNLVSFTTLDGMDLSASWWDQGTANFMISDKIYFMNGSIVYSDEGTTYVMLFNKQMANDEDIDPYKMVYDNEWTLDNFQSLIKNVSFDSNGDGKFGVEDTYGFVSTWETGSTFFFGAGLRYIVCEEGSDPYLALDSSAMSKASDLLDKVLAIYYVNNSTFSSDPGKEGDGKSIFVGGRGLFYSEVVMYIVALGKEMETDFGVLPVPKYNSEQENYITWTNGICSTSSISKAAKNLERLGPTLEALAIISQQRVTPAYYDTVLQRKSVRDEESQGMLDIIFKTRTYDLCMYYSNIGLEPLFKTSVNDNKTNFASNYSKKSKSAQKTLDKLIAKFAKDE